MHSKLTCTSLAVLIGCTTATESPLTHLQVDVIESGGIQWERLALTDGIVGPAFGSSAQPGYSCFL